MFCFETTLIERRNKRRESLNVIQMSGWEDLIIAAELSTSLFPSSPPPPPPPVTGLHFNLKAVSSQPKSQQTAEHFANTFWGFSISAAVNSSCKATPFLSSPSN